MGAGQPAHRSRLRLAMPVVAMLLVVATSIGAQPSAAVASPAAVRAGIVALTGFVLPLAPPPLLLTAFRPPTNRFGAGHRGVDLAAGEGSAVFAAGSGVVVFAASLAGRGVVSIEHAGGLRTTYEPVTASVMAGTRIAAGAGVGTLEAGHAGCAPATCLHWGARLPDRLYLDPMSLLASWRVRLLPWDGR